MFDTVYFYLALVVVIFALGDLISHITKGRLSGLMMVMLLFNMGTTVNLRQLIREWRTVALAVLLTGSACVAMLIVGAPLIGAETVWIGMPSVNGATIATSLMSEAAIANGMPEAAAMCAVICAVQRLVGTPIASAMGRRYAVKLLKEYRQDPQAVRGLLTAGQGGGAHREREPFYLRHKALFTSNVQIAITCTGAFLARFLGSCTPIDYSIWALLLGLLSGLGGYLPPKPLQNGNAYGLILIAVFGSIIPALGGVSIQDLGAMALQIAVLFAAACGGIFLSGWLLPAWKLVGSRDLAAGIGAMQFVGFPSNVVICREVSEAVGQTEEEKRLIDEALSVPYVVGSITVVTILSVVLAGIISSRLFTAG